MSKKRRRLLDGASGPSGQKFGITINQYVVGSWCPTPDGSGPATAVSIELDMQWNREHQVSAFLRLKTPKAVDTMIQSLLRHKRDVWPDAP